MTISLVCTPLKRLGKASEIMYGNLLCISLDGSFKDPIWAVVAHCEASAKETTAHVRLCSEYNQHDDFAALRLLQRCRTTLMAESPTYFNAVRPVLRALQLHDVDAVPFKSELVDACRPSKTGGLDAAEYITPESTLDASRVFPSNGGYGSGTAHRPNLLRCRSRSSPRFFETTTRRDILRQEPEAGDCRGARAACGGHTRAAWNRQVLRRS